jgi:CHAD domain-containing protein
MLANVEVARLADAEGIHQLRVAIRRARAALVLFRPRLHAATVQGFDAELQRIGRVFGEARDWDVFVLEILAAASADAPVPGWLDLVSEAAEAKRAAAHRSVRDELSGTAFTRLVLGMAGWIEDGLHTPALLGDAAMEQPIADLAPALMDRAARKVAKRGRALEDASAEDLHALRRSTKKLRYGAEFLSGLYPRKRVKAHVHAGKELQSLLGNINDAAMTRVFAARLSEEHADLAPAIGTLADWSDKRAKKALQRLPKAWDAFCEAKQFWE